MGEIYLDEHKGKGCVDLSDVPLERCHLVDFLGILNITDFYLLFSYIRTNISVESHVNNSHV
jgi:hypothetical protein